MTMRSKLRREVDREEGAAAVEFALIVGLLAILVFGLLEYGLAFWQVQNLRAAAREGARIAAVRGNTSQISSAMVQASSGSLPAGFTGFSADKVCNSTTAGQEVTVRINNGALSGSVQEAFEISIPFLPPFTLNPRLSGTFRCE